jgi:hypothetical protein
MQALLGKISHIEHIKAEHRIENGGHEKNGQAATGHNKNKQAAGAHLKIGFKVACVRNWQPR